MGQIEYLQILLKGYLDGSKETELEVQRVTH
jgi:hypothetical protein